MASNTKTTTMSSVTLVSGGSAYPALKVSGSATLTRESSSDTNVTVAVTLKFTLGGGTSASYLLSGYQIDAYGNTGGANDNSGWTSREIKDKDASWYGNTVVSKTWTRTFKLTGSTLTFKLYTDGSGSGTYASKYSVGSKSSPAASWSLQVPTYSGGDTSSTKNSITAFSLTPTSVEKGGTLSVSCTGKAGSTGNNLAGFFITTTKKGTTGTSLYLSSAISSGSGTATGTIIAPNVAGSYTYYAYPMTSSGTENYDSEKSVTIAVKEIKPTISSASTTSIPTTGGSTYLSTNTSTNKFAYCIGSASGTKTVVNSSGTWVYVDGRTTIYCWAYDPNNSSENQYSSSYKTVSISTYTPVVVNDITITPTILKDNLSAPDLVNAIRGQASVSGANSYTWQYCQSSTQSGLGSASWQNLGVSSSSFSEVNMAEKVAIGYYYKIRLRADNDNDYDYSSDSEIFQIPVLPGAPTITKVVPKANPADGYTENTQDNKIYYGSGVFLLWNNPTITDSHLPIKDIELVYQQRKAGMTEYSSSDVAKFKYFNLNGTVYNDPPYTDGGASNGGGADLEVESLYETKVGIRIIDTLGQSSETFYNTTYYKAESPSFGGALEVNQNYFRPFACDENDYLIFTSSIARASSQDELRYFIDCYVPDRRETIELIKDIPISTSAFSTSYADNKILYPVGGTGNEDIVAYMTSTTRIGYKVKNSYFKKLLLSNKALRSPTGNASPVYNDDFSEVVYKISVRDNFDSRSTVYNSAPVTINYIETPQLGGRNPNGFEIGVNRYIKSKNPFDDNSVLIANESTTAEERIVNPGESIVLTFKRAKDYNAADYLTDCLGDVVSYNVYISRLDTIPNSYKDLTYTLLKTYSVNELKKKKPNDSNNDYYYLEYPIVSYQNSKFITFKLEAVDSKNNVSDAIYSTSYLIPCRAQSMDYRISTVKLYDNTGTFQPLFKLKVDDLGAATFINSSYTYDTYHNLERTYSIYPTGGTSVGFARKCQILLEGCLDGNFDNHGTTVLKKAKSIVETLAEDEKSVSNWFSMTYDPIAHSGGKKYNEGILEESILFGDVFPEEWTVKIDNKTKLDEEYITKIFFRVTTIIAYGLNDIELSNTLESGRYLTTISTTASYSFYDDAPTVSYRNHQVGINTKDFNVDSDSGLQEVLIIQDNGSYNLVVFKGAEQKIYLNLTERRFYTTTNDEKNPQLINEVDFGNGVINGMKIDGGEW